VIAAAAYFAGAVLVALAGTALDRWVVRREMAADRRRIAAEHALRDAPVLAIVRGVPSAACATCGGKTPADRQLCWFCHYELQGGKLENLRG
jgi:hypothetical protein